MSVIDTNLAIERFRAKREIHENITIITAIEFPPVLSYEKFLEEVYTITPEDQILAIKIQRLLRKIGKPKSSSDILIASICINRNEELITKDKDFLDIAKVSNLKVKLIE
jgi:predicted nucleic acid-binding protein